MPLLEKIAKSKCGVTKKDQKNTDIFAIKNSHASSIEKKM